MLEERAKRSTNADLCPYSFIPDASIHVGKTFFSSKDFRESMDLHQGDCIHLKSSEELFQVIGVDDEHKRCWVRKWPLQQTGSPVFEVPIKHVAFTNQTTPQIPISNI